MVVYLILSCKIQQINSAFFLCSGSGSDCGIFITGYPHKDSGPHNRKIVSVTGRVLFPAMNRIYQPDISTTSMFIRISN